MAAVAPGDVDANQPADLAEGVGDGGEAVLVELGDPAGLVGNSLIIRRADKRPVGALVVQDDPEILVDVQRAFPRLLQQDVMLHGFVHVGENGFAAVEGDQEQQRLVCGDGSVHVGGSGIFQKGHGESPFGMGCCLRIELVSNPYKFNHL